MTREFQAVSQISRSRNVDMRTAAYVHALTRLGEAIASKGTRTYFANNAG
jgi:glutamate dehydrogenase (NADP+)